MACTPFTYCFFDTQAECVLQQCIVVLDDCWCRRVFPYSGHLEKSVEPNLNGLVKSKCQYV